MKLLLPPVMMLMIMPFIYRVVQKKCTLFKNSRPHCCHASGPAMDSPISRFRKVPPQFSQLSAISFAQPCTWRGFKLCCDPYFAKLTFQSVASSALGVAIIPSCSNMLARKVHILHSRNIGGKGCVFPRPGRLRPRGRLHATIPPMLREICLSSVN